MHPYYLPSEAELVHKKGLIASHNARISFLEASIECETKSLEDAVEGLNKAFQPSIEAIKAIIAHQQQELSNLESRKQSSETDLKQLSERKIASWEEQRARLQREVELEQGFIAPIRRLPTEMLSEVFIWAELVMSPWTLTKVCKSWRAVALHTPRLWTRISLVYFQNNYQPNGGITYRSKLPLTDSYQVSRQGESCYISGRITYQTNTGIKRTDPNQYCRTLEGLRKALELTGNSPLHITINFSTYLFGGGQEERRSMMELIIGQFPRCRTIIIERIPNMRDLGHEGMAAQFANMDLSALEELEFHTVDNTEMIDLVLLATRKTASKLSRLTLAYPHQPEIYPSVKFEVRHLKYIAYLCIGNCTSSPIKGECEAWSSMTNLTQLEFNNQDLSKWSGASLPSLERLAICGGTITNLGGSLPTVKFLYLQDVPLPWTHQIISTPLLETLIIYGERIEIAKIFEAPRLDDLHLYYTAYRMTMARWILPNIWNSKSSHVGAGFINPRRLFINIPKADKTLGKALSLMNRIENLVVAIRGRSSIGKKLIEDLSIKPQMLIGRGRRDHKVGICPNLKTFEVFRVEQNGRPTVWSDSEERTQLQLLMLSLKLARPNVVCKVTHNHVAEDWFMIN